MIPGEFEYHAAKSVDEAVKLLGQYGDDAKLLAGGHSLIPALKLRLQSVGHLIDLGRISGLDGIKEAGGKIAIGAMTTYTEVLASAEARARPILGEVCATIADVQVRNRGTIGGNVCLNLPTNHFPTVLLALQADFVVAGPDGERVVPADGFFESTFSTAVRPGELLTAVRVPRLPAGTGDAFLAMSAGKESQSIVHVTASVTLDDVVTAARVAVGCVGPRPVQATAVERALLGARLDASAAREAAARLGTSLSPVSDVNATADFKRHVAEVLVERVVLMAAERARRRGD